MTLVDVRYPVSGDCLFLGYEYALFGALCHLHLLKGRPEIGILPLQGVRRRPAKLLTVEDGCELILRAPVGACDFVGAYANKQIRVGRHVIDLGRPRITIPRPSEALFCERLTYTWCKPGRDRKGPDEARWWRKTLENLNVPLEHVRIGKRTPVVIGGRPQYGWAVQLRGLSDDQSLRIQQRFFGARKHFGCGAFLPGELRDDLRKRRHKTIVRIDH